MQNEALNQDASNRALRTFLTGMFIDVCVGLVLAVSSAFAGANGWSDFQWAILAFSLVKSVVQSAASYVLRRYIDPSRIPTPLPPTPQPAPATADPAP